MIAGDSRLTAVVLGLIVLGAVLMALSIFSPRRRVPLAASGVAPGTPAKEPDRLAVALEQAAEPSEIVGILEPAVIVEAEPVEQPAVTTVAPTPEPAQAAARDDVQPSEPLGEPVVESSETEVARAESAPQAMLEPVGLPEYAALLEPAELPRASAVAAEEGPQQVAAVPAEAVLEPVAQVPAEIPPEPVRLPEVAMVGEAPEIVAVAQPEAGWLARIDANAGAVDRDTRADLIARLGFVGDAWAIEILAHAYREEHEPRMRDAIVAALASSRALESREPLREALRSDRASERSLAVDALADAGEFDALVPLLADTSLPVAIGALHALHRNGARAAIEAFLDADPQSDRTRELETVLSILRPRRR